LGIMVATLGIIEAALLWYKLAGLFY